MQVPHHHTFAYLSQPGQSVSYGAANEYSTGRTDCFESVNQVITKPSWFRPAIKQRMITPIERISLKLRYIWPCTRLARDSLDPTNSKQKLPRVQTCFKLPCCSIASRSSHPPRHCPRTKISDVEKHFDGAAKPIVRQKLGKASSARDRASTSHLRKGILDSSWHGTLYTDIVHLRISPQGIQHHPACIAAASYRTDSNFCRSQENGNQVDDVLACCGSSSSSTTTNLLPAPFSTSLASRKSILRKSLPKLNEAEKDNFTQRGVPGCKTGMSSSRT